MGYSPFPILEERWLPHLERIRDQGNHDLQRVRGAIAGTAGQDYGRHFGTRIPDELTRIAGQRHEQVVRRSAMQTTLARTSLPNWVKGSLEARVTSIESNSRKGTRRCVPETRPSHGGTALQDSALQQPKEQLQREAACGVSGEATRGVLKSHCSTRVDPRLCHLLRP